MYASIGEVWGARHPIHQQQARRIEKFSQEQAAAQQAQQAQQAAAEPVQQPAQQPVQTYVQQPAQQPVQPQQPPAVYIPQQPVYQQPFQQPQQIQNNAQIVDILTKLISLNHQLESAIAQYTQPMQPVQGVPQQGVEAFNGVYAQGVSPVVVFLLMVIVGLLAYMVGTSKGSRVIEV